MTTYLPDFGAALKKLLYTHSLSQSQLAAKAGMDHSYISRLCGSVREPSRGAIEDIARAFKLEADETDALLMAGGYLPADPANVLLLLEEGELVQVLQTLQRDEVPESAKSMLRAQCRLAMQTVRLCVGLERLFEIPRIRGVYKRP